MSRRKHPLRGAYHDLLVYAEGEGANRPGLAETPARAARAWKELTAGYDMVLDFKTFDAEKADGILTQRVTFYSLCEHHLLPFFGTVDYCYLPGKRIVGLSKFKRLTEVYARRLQVQERLTNELLFAVETLLKPRGAMVITRAQHLCMAMRGVTEQGAITTYSEASGVILKSPTTKAEAMALLP